METIFWPGSGHEFHTQRRRAKIPLINAIIFREDYHGAVAGVSLRTLYADFHDFRHQSPMETLCQVRLERVRQTPLTDTGTASITEIAMGWGFTHMGALASVIVRYLMDRPARRYATEA